MRSRGGGTACGGGDKDGLTTTVYQLTWGSLSGATATDTTTYTYGDSNWSDKLTSYDGQTISYDESGNPTSYKGATITWNGRLMTSYTDGSCRYEYEYNSDGMRTVRRMYKKGELTSTVRYIWDGDVLLGSRIETVDGDESITVRYLYDDSGELYAMDYNGNGFFGFIKNLQGDIVSIVPLDPESNVELNMEYDAWGKPILEESSFGEAFMKAMIIASTNVAYRGYFYDIDTELCYLRSRYYDPETGRFINADDTAYLGYDASPLSMNLFAYCENNPVNGVDYSGYYVASCAYAYADKWWCFYNPAYKRNDDNADCANFVSQCLFEGGLSKMTKTWYNKKILGFYKISSAWGRANDLYHWLKNGKYIKRQIIVKNKKELSESVKKYLYGKSWCIATVFFDWENDGKIDHATLSGQTTRKNGLYDLYYFAHSSMRNGRMSKYYPRHGNPYYAPVSATLKDNCRVYICLLV